MNTATTDNGLAFAFRRFEQAAIDLEQRHARLQDDVTRLEGHLHDSNRRLETVLDALDHGVGVVDAEGRLLRANRALRQLAPVDEHSRPRPEPLARMLTDGTEVGSTVCITLETADGSREFTVTLLPTGDDAGTRVLTLHDITEIRRQGEEGGRRRRLEALGRMAAELAHEVRNPLGSIRLWGCLLRDDLDAAIDRGFGGPGEPPIGPEQRTMVEQILSAVAGLESTVSNLLSFAVPRRGTHASFDLAAAAADACSLVAPACAVRGVTIEGPSDPPCVLSGDAESLRQVVLNLIGNALAATTSGGTIRVGVESHDASVVRLVVSDDGRGIEPDDLPRVFDPFFSRTEGGTGLGLSIAHRTIERHGGRIVVDSQPGHGTTVAAELPLGGAAKE